MDTNRVAELFEALKNDGGFTVSWTTGRKPKRGFALSPYAREFWVRGSKLTVEHLEHYVEENLDLLVEPNTYFGAWQDGDRVYLDCSVVLNDRKQVEKLCRLHGQLAYFDLSKKETVRL